MVRRDPRRAQSITTAPQSPPEELRHRQRRYAALAAVFVTCFASAALLYRHTALALLLCGIAMVTLVVAVVGANRPR